MTPSFLLAIALIQTPTLPDTPAGNMARELLAVVGSGDATKMRAFADSNAPKQAEDVYRLTHKMWEQSGGIEVLKVEGKRSILMRIKTKRGDRYADMLVAIDEAGKLGEFWVAPQPSPTDIATAELPKAKLRAGEIAPAIDRSVQAYVEQGRFSGTVLVMKNDRQIFHKSYGLANRSYSIRNTASTRYHMASMGKMLTAVAIGQLLDQGKLTLETSVAELLPEYPNKEAARKITVAHLLQHRAGLGSIYDSPKFDRTRRYVWGVDYFPAYAEQPLIFEPGTDWSYSNAGFVLLQTIIEKISGQRYAEYLQRHVLEPAGMVGIGIYDLDDPIPNMAEGYMHGADDPFALDPIRTNRSIVPMPGNGAGGGYATAEAMARFAIALTQGKLVTKRTFALLTTQQIGRSYACGFDTFTANGKKGVGHSGGGPNIGINSALEFFLDGSYVVVVMSNSDAPAAQNLATSIREMLARQ